MRDAKDNLEKNNGHARSWGWEVQPFCLLEIFFRVTHDGISEIGTTHSLDIGANTSVRHAADTGLCLHYKVLFFASNWGVSFFRFHQPDFVLAHTFVLDA